MNEYKFTEEDINKSIEENERFIEEYGHTLRNDSYDISALDKDTQIKLAHIELKERHNREIVDLQNKNASRIEEENLLRLHKEEEAEFFKRQYSTNEDEKLRADKLLKLKMAKEKDIIDVEDFELLFGLSKETQKQYRSRIKNPIPTISGGKGKKVLYDKKAVEKWNKRR